MRHALFLLTLVAGCSEAQRPASTPSPARDAEPAAAGVATGAGATGQPPMSTPPTPPDGLSELGFLFPLTGWLSGA